MAFGPDYEAILMFPDDVFLEKAKAYRDNGVLDSYIQKVCCFCCILSKASSLLQQIREDLSTYSVVASGSAIFAIDLDCSLKRHKLVVQKPLSVSASHAGIGQTHPGFGLDESLFFNTVANSNRSSIRGFYNAMSTLSRLLTAIKDATSSCLALLSDVKRYHQSNAPECFKLVKS